MEPLPPSAPRSSRVAGLAVAGFALLAAAYAALSVGFFSGRSSLATPLGYALGAAGLACHVAAVVLSLRTWRRGGGLPVVALVYAALAVAGGVWQWSARADEARWYREDPARFTAEPAGDGLDVRDARGMWHVALSRCPGALPSGFATRQRNGVIEVLGAGDVPFMRLAVAARRVECLAVSNGLP